MSTSQTRTGLFETPKKKKIGTPVTPRMSSRSSSGSRNTGSSDQIKSGSLTPTNNSSRHSVNIRSSVDRSIPSNSRAAGSGKGTPGKGTPGKETPGKGTPGKETDFLHTEVSLAHENLSKAKNYLSFAEKEKNELLKELKEAKDQAQETVEKLALAIAARKVAEDRIETEKFRSVELEQTGIETSLQQEIIWKKQLDGVRAQHSADLAALASATKEVERLKHEVTMAVEARKAANVHADEALTIAEVNAEKVSMLSGEVTRLKALMRSELERKEREAEERVQKLNEEMEILRSELVNAKESEMKMIEMEDLIETLKMDISQTKNKKTEMENAAQKWKEKSKDLERRLEEALQSERIAAESLLTASNRLRESRSSLEVAESELVGLKSKVKLLEIELSRHGAVLANSENGNRQASSEMMEMGKTIEALKSEIRNLEEKKSMAVENERRATSELQTMVDQKSKLVGELRVSNEKRDHTKKSMDDLTTALDQVTVEARDSQEMLLKKQTEFSDAKKKIIELEHALKTTEEKYKATLKEAQNEIIHLQASIEASASFSIESKSERSGKEVEYVSYLKQSHEQVISLKSEMDKMVGKLKGVELEAARAKEDGADLSEKLNVAISEASSSNEAAEEARTERLEAKAKLSEKEDALRNVSDENKSLRTREEATQKKIEELSKQLENNRTEKKKNLEFSAVVVETDVKKERVERMKDEKEVDGEEEVEEEEAVDTDGRSSSHISVEENEYPESKRRSRLLSKFGMFLKKKKKSGSMKE
ncbi:hypothetical protein ZOSMA_76G00990 [Zostera marina]|uniref:WEB family protein n=1 Tax=Zostera marina TaxID=29655 RepID=A0A0K9NP39_ZOSMR|nr:hypothetical protein ZOSMA_76G00990 [Zostera marina]